ncbi:unnamed protein product [Pleuronectes platessa]|uniref:Uncharacterized protein n=1 Tax=Pleuronectes platessa TaxID=8262 RepID=A0A9N7YLT1_PLEPL|nr:unnamed protein product [Pleuronectes platessa]
MAVLTGSAGRAVPYHVHTSPGRQDDRQWELRRQIGLSRQLTSTAFLFSTVILYLPTEAALIAVVPPLPHLASALDMRMIYITRFTSSSARVLRYLGCLLPGLNGHIVLPPAAALQTTGSSTHTCQAMSLAPRVLRHSRAPLPHTWLLNPRTTRKAHTSKQSHTDK